MSRQRAKGTRFERAVVDYLNQHGHPNVERRALNGKGDRGDILGLIGWIIECKATQRIDLSGALDQAKTAAKHAGTTDYAAIVKRRNHPTAGAYVVMPLEVFARLLDEED